MCRFVGILLVAVHLAVGSGAVTYAHGFVHADEAAAAHPRASEARPYAPADRRHDPCSRAEPSDGHDGGGECDHDGHGQGDHGQGHQGRDPHGRGDHDPACPTCLVLAAPVLHATADRPVLRPWQPVPGVPAADERPAPRRALLRIACRGPPAA